MMVAKRYSSISVAVVVLMIATRFVLPDAALASGGIGVFPVQIEVDNALRGAEYLRTVTVINQEENDMRVTLHTDGDIADWITAVDSDNHNVAVEEVIIPSKVRGQIVLKIVVPEDAPNGPHTGGVRFQGLALSAQGQTAVGVSIGIAADIVVNVGGTQVLSGIVTDIAIDNAEVNQPPVRLRVQFSNTGNVDTRPVVTWHTSNAAGAAVGRIEYSETTVKAGLAETIVIEWDPTGQPEGTYTSNVNVQIEGTVLANETVTFDLLPVGSLTRSGTLENVILEGEPQPGTVAKVVGVFRNTGQIDTRATFMAEIYRESQLVQTVESRERLVTVAELAFIESFFDVKEAGAYTVRGKVYFEGKETDYYEIAFQVAPVAQHPANNPVTSEAPVTAPAPAPVEVPATTSSDRGSPMIWAIAVGAGVAVAIIFITLLLTRRAWRGAEAQSVATTRQQTESSKP